MNPQFACTKPGRGAPRRRINAATALRPCTRMGAPWAWRGGRRTGPRCAGAGPRISTGMRFVDCR